MYKSSVYSTLFLLWLGHLLVDFMIGIWPVYKTIAHLDLAIAGLISGVAALVGEGLQVVFGSLSDRGYGKILILGGLAATVASAFLAYTQDYLFLFFLFSLTCLGSGAFHPCAVALLGNLTADRKGLFITIFWSGGALGLAFSQLVFSGTYRLLSGNVVWLAIPTFMLISAILIFGFAQASPRPNQSTKKHKFATIGRFFLRQDLTLLYVSQLCNQTVAWATVFLLPDILISRGYVDWVALGGGHLFYVLGAALMMVPAGYLADKYSCKAVVVSANVMGFILLYTLLLTPEIPLLALLPMLLLLGAASGVVSPVQVAFGNRLVPDDPGLISAFLMGLVWCVAEGLGQGGGGLLTKYFESDSPAKALGCVGVCLLIGMTAAMRLPGKAEPQESVLDVVNN